MKMSTRVIKLTNHIFPKQKHPFNMENEGSKTYAQWQFENGAKTIAFFNEKYSPQEMFAGKDVLDMGCGAAGKSIYYASLGAKRVVGVDVVTSYQKEAEGLAAQLGYSDVFEFICIDATTIPFAEKTFDTIIMNDFMEHANDPEKVLAEAFRLLKDGGRIYINFPPYYHPFGAHLSDTINMPWVHMFFSDKMLINAYKEFTRGVPDGEERIKFRISKNSAGEEYFSYINKMTIKKFDGLLKKLNLTPKYYHEAALRGFLAPMAHGPLRECLIKMVVCVLERDAK